MLLPILLAALLLLSGRTLCRPPEEVRLEGASMGTSWSVVLRAPDLRRARIREARQAVRKALDDVDHAMSTWDPDSEISRLNAHRSDRPFPLSAPTLRVLSVAQQVAARSGGAFDVTVRPLVALWGFGAGARVPGDAPSEAELVAARAVVGYAKLKLDLDAGVARKRVFGLEVDLSALAKGYGVDRAAEALWALGFRNFLVEVGGELVARGERSGGGPWRVAVERPESEGRAIHGVVGLQNQAMATSGDYRSFYEAGGERRTHIIDPRTAAPIRHGLASVSVVHREAVWADAWATALSVLGPEEGPGVARREGLGAYFISRGPDGRYRTVATSGFPRILRVTRAEGDDPPPDE